MLHFPAQASLESEQQTVRELMRLENDLAIAAARQRKTEGVAGGRQRAAGSDFAASNSPEALRLVGIYGVGKRLFAEVRSGSRAFLFLNGQPWPVGHVKGGENYRLKELAGRCVRLERHDEETVLCLPQAGGRG